jgi:hypothetical protein
MTQTTEEADLPKEMIRWAIELVWRLEWVELAKWPGLFKELKESWECGSSGRSRKHETQEILGFDLKKKEYY